MLAAAIITIIVVMLLTGSAAGEPVSGSALSGGSDYLSGLLGSDPLTAVLNDFGGSAMTQSTLDKMAWAVTQQEGGPGDRNYRNNNPGNLKASSGYWQGQTGTDPEGFAIFDTWNNGWRALELDLRNHAAANPGQSLTDFFAQYSPDSTGLSGVYGGNIAAALGVSPDTTLGSLL